MTRFFPTCVIHIGQFLTHLAQQVMLHGLHLNVNSNDLRFQNVFEDSNQVSLLKINK